MQCRPLGQRLARAWYGNIIIIISKITWNWQVDRQYWIPAAITQSLHPLCTFFGNRTITSCHIETSSKSQVVEQNHIIENYSVTLTLNPNAATLRTPNNIGIVDSRMPLIAHAGVFRVTHNTRRCSNRENGLTDLSTYKNKWQSFCVSKEWTGNMWIKLLE